MHLLLPSSTDIYLTGGKSHESEIRLAKFLIKSLDKEDTFLDVGAHYGYFSLLAAELVGVNGAVFSFEGSPASYGVLEKNNVGVSQLETVHSVVSDVSEDVIFYVFPNLYSEYNSLDVTQYENEDWFSKYPATQVKINSIVLDEFLETQNITPKIIKIDVEGAEYKVLNGLRKHLISQEPIIVIEYLSQIRGDSEHIKADKLLNSLGYSSYIIDEKGELRKVESIPDYIKSKRIESDNVVFMKI